MPATRKPRSKTAAREPTAVLLRLPGNVLTELDRWLDELNATRDWPGLTRAELLRAIVSDAVKHRRGAP